MKALFVLILFPFIAYSQEPAGRPPIHDFRDSSLRRVTEIFYKDFKMDTIIMKYDTLFIRIGYYRKPKK